VCFFSSEAFFSALFIFLSLGEQSLYFIRPLLCSVPVVLLNCKRRGFFIAAGNLVRMEYGFQFKTARHEVKKKLVFPYPVGETSSKAPFGSEIGMEGEIGSRARA
jgi:hypothetical protein